MSRRSRRTASPRKRAGEPPAARRARPQPVEPGELEALRARLEHGMPAGSGMRWNADPGDVHRSVGRLVLTLVEFIRQLLERQAIRRMEGGTLTAAETEDIGRALMQLEETVRELSLRFGLEPEDLNLELGPLGKMM